MSTAYSSAKQKYIGNGVTTEWGFDFPIQKHSELKVYLKRSGMPQVLLEEGVDYSFVTENTIAFPIKTGEAKLQAADVLAMQRESVFESEYNFSNQQRLEPEEVMHADDNLERQIQELKRDSESSIKVFPTSSIEPTTLVEHVERVYGSVDNIDTVANDKANVDAVAGSITKVNTVAGDIESVKTVANNIESVVVDATNISRIKTVAGSIANVNKTAGSIDNVNVVAPSISSVNTVATNISSVNTAATNIAAIKAAPTAATNAAQSAANAANSATISANSAIWAEGTDAQVQALGGVHSSKGWAEKSTNANVSLSNLSAAGQAKFDAKANVSNTVTTNTAQTITGQKAFNSGSGNNRTNIDIITNDGVADDTNVKWAGSIQFKKGNVSVGFCEALRNDINSSVAQIVAYKSVNGQNVFAFLRSVVTSEGYIFATAPTPSIGAAGDEIVTAGWFRQSNCSVRTVIETYHKGTEWYRIWSDGWIEQGGLGNAGGNIVHTLLKPFSNANYTITATPYVEGSAATDTYAVTIKSKTASRFTSYLSTVYLHFNWQACGY